MAGPRSISPADYHRFAFISLGSNLGDSRRLLSQAAEQLQSLSMAPLEKSSLWSSAPIGCPPGSPPFLNAVAAIVPPNSMEPEGLLEQLQALEREFGRAPKIVLNEPRPLDLDLIVFRDQIRRTGTLTLPHPRAHHRLFVLGPLSELAPELILPGQTEPVREQIVKLPSQEARPLEEPW